MLENLAAVCAGELLKKPSVTAVTSFTAEPQKVTRGAAFFSYDGRSEDISEALSRGAYAIIHEQNIQTDDNEIAWIKVDNIEKAMIRFMRFLVETRTLNAILLDRLQFDMLRLFKLQFEAKFIPTNIKEIFSQLIVSEETGYIFCTDKGLLEQIAPQFESIKKSAEATILQSHSIFKTSFVSGENYFKDFSLPALFVGEFAALIEFLDKKKLPFKVDAIEKTGHFEPIFVNTILEARPFGTTNQAIIIETNEKLFECEIDWLKNYVSDEYLLILAPHNAKITTQCKRYTSAKSLQTISIKSLRYILVLGDREQIIEALEEPKQLQGTLF
jgi:ferrochelatase